MHPTTSERFGLVSKLIGCGSWMLLLMNQQDAVINDDDAAIHTNRIAADLRNLLSKASPPTPEEQWELLNHGELHRRLSDWNQRILSRLIQRQQRADWWPASNDDGGPASNDDGGPASNDDGGPASNDDGGPANNDECV